MTEYTLETIVLPSGTLTVKLWHGNSSLVVPSGGFILSLGEFTERVDILIGALELPSVQVRCLDICNSTYTRGFLYYCFAESRSTYTDVPQLHFILNEGAGDTSLFWGRIDIPSVQFTEVSTITTKEKFVEFQVVDVLQAARYISWGTLITEMKALAEDNEALDSRPVLTLSNGGASGTTHYTYRVAARTAAGEQLWGDAVEITNGPESLNQTDHILIEWDAITGATEYAVYRTATTSTLNLGYIGKVAAPWVSFQDSGLGGDDSNAQSKYSAWKYVSLKKIMAEILYLASGGSYNADTAVFANNDIRYDELFGANLYVLLWYNTGTLDSPVMGYTPFFDSTDLTVYSGLGGRTVLNWFGDFCRGLLGIPKHYYSITNARHEIELLTRGRVGANYLTMGDVISSEVSTQQYQTLDRVRAYRVVEEEDYYELNLMHTPGVAQNVLEVPLQFLFQSDPAINSYEKYYVVNSTSGLGNIFAPVAKVEYYDYTTMAWVEPTATVETQEAVCQYYANLGRTREKRTIRRRYATVKAATTGAAAQTNLRLCQRTQISDGAATKTFYAHEITKDIVNDTSEVLWIEQ